MKFKSLYLTIIVGMFLISSCSSDDDANVSGDEYEIPVAYEFSRNGETSVSFSGQTDRLNMLTEISNYMKTDANWPLDETKLINMFSNAESPFDDSNLNSSTKNIKSKTAASKDYFSANTVAKAEIQAEFEAWFAEGTTASQSGAVTASEGVAGIADGSRLVNGNGLEIQQVIEKSLMGACFLDQMLNNYLSVSVLDEADSKANNDDEVLEEDENYTFMEHKWDEAYGYTYGAGGELFWDKYIDRVEGDSDFAGIAAEIDEAFRTGRAAIVNSDYETRDAQSDILREKLSMIAAIRAVYYLQAGKAKLVPDAGAAFHDLSEGFGFIYSLQFTRQPGTDIPYFSRTEVQEILDDLLAGNNGLWDVDHLDTVLDEISTKIAGEFDFTVSQAATVD